MSKPKNPIKLFIFFAFAAPAFFTASVPAQSSEAAAQKEVAGTQVARIVAPEPTPSDVKPTSTPSMSQPADLQSDIAAVKAENAAVREMLRKMEEQQKALLEQMERLQKRLDSSTTSDSKSSADTQTVSGPPVGADSVPMVAPPYAVLGPPPGQPAAKQVEKEDRYRDGIVIWQTPDDVKVPFLLRLNINTQERYLNTLDSPDTFTDHLGVVREVHRRNDITVNRAMFILGGYIFDKRLIYSYTVWTSAGSNSLVLAGNIGWRFNKNLTLTAGYFGVPGSRTLTNTFPYWTGMDRSMADNFFRPAFTQGLQANGDIVKGLHYYAFLGNGLNTLAISANKIDTNLMGSGSVWWEPLGDYGPGGASKTVNMYDDYFGKKKLRIRIGSSFTASREDRFSNLDQTAPDNTSIHNSDGVLTFSTGAFAPGVTVQQATYKMWAADWGVKYSGLAINGQYYARWLSNFVADGPMPLKSTFDHGFELSTSYFVVPKKLIVYGRGSVVFGQFNNSWEYAGGVKWHFLPTERLWLQGELMRVNRVPYGGAFTPYTAGLTGWVPMIQTILAF